MRAGAGGTVGRALPSVGGRVEDDRDVPGGGSHRLRLIPILLGFQAIGFDQLMSPISTSEQKIHSHHREWRMRKVLKVISWL